MKLDVAEIITILVMGAIAVSSIFKLQAGSAEKIALSIGSALGGYLAKSGYDAVRSVMPAPRPGTPEVK
jgi:hypothetical protein